MRNISKQLIFVSCLLAFLVLELSCSTKPIKEKEITENEVEFAVIDVSLDKLLAEYEENEVSADLKFRDKILLLTGEIGSIGKNRMDNYFVTLKSVQMMDEVHCSFSKEVSNKAVELKKGQTITIKGKCEGKVLNIVLVDCSIE